MYVIYRAYTDGSVMTDTAEDIVRIFGACQIYVDEPTLKVLRVWDPDNNVVVNFRRAQLCGCFFNHFLT